MKYLVKITYSQKVSILLRDMSVPKVAVENIPNFILSLAIIFYFIFEIMSSVYLIVYAKECRHERR
jgi:hypothetical protein